MAMLERRGGISAVVAVGLLGCGGPGSDDGSSTDVGGTAETASETGDPPIEFTCAPERSFPYPSPMSYVGVHAGPGNDDLVDCELGSDWAQTWHALDGRGIAQPNTFSPDGRTTYVASSGPAADDCTIWALDVETGEQDWCVAVPGALFATVEVDLDGNLYTTADAAVLSWDPDGQPRWAAAIPGDDPERNATGVHFTPAGHVATITDAGVVMLVDRSDGGVVATYDIPAELGLVPAASLGLDLDFDALLPDAVREDFAGLHGAGNTGGALGKFAGGSGNYSDNTIAIGPSGDLYVIGGGLDEDHGALVQLHVDGAEISPGWLVELVGGSASSPAVSPDGAWVKVSDGNTLANFLEPSMAEAHAHVISIAACDANTDANPDPERCVAEHQIPLLTGPSLGASPVFANAESWRWEVQFAALYDQAAPDVIQSLGAGAGVEISLPDDRVWSSVLTLTRGHVVGTMTALTASQTDLLTITLPATASSELVVLERGGGEPVFRAAITDDATSTVTVGPDGSLYVTMLALLHTLSTDTRPVGGIIRFAPTDN